MLEILLELQNPEAFYKEKQALCRLEGVRQTNGYLCSAPDKEHVYANSLFW